MLDKLAEIARRYSALEDKLSYDNLDSQEFTSLSQEYAKLKPIVEQFQQYQGLAGDLEVAKEMMASEDKELQTDGYQESQKIEKAMQALENELVILLLPKDPLDNKNVILEIRAGTGGDEAALFAMDLARMYQKFAEKQSWIVETMSITPSSAGGYKEAIYLISGSRVYSSLKHEIGVHRVQRVPATESQGRLHTSACTVAVLAELDDVEIDIKPSDLDIKTCRASGAGGQHVNKTDSAIRITHLPSGIAVECQDERSQHKNKEKAMKILKSRLFEAKQKESQAQRSSERKHQVGSGDRSERIRTYNFPQGRITDHRLSLTLYRLTEILEGDLGELVDKLGAQYTADLLRYHHENQ
ncbi:MAG: peptide chain release factor 1 [Proteobacteria bacterium]|nr:peptide chain release factor 1 [Pseudomonadota bacterium]